MTWGPTPPIQKQTLSQGNPNYLQKLLKTYYQSWSIGGAKTGPSTPIPAASCSVGQALLSLSFPFCSTQMATQWPCKRNYSLCSDHNALSALGCRYGSYPHSIVTCIETSQYIPQTGTIILYESNNSINNKMHRKRKVRLSKCKTDSIKA